MYYQWFKAVFQPFSRFFLENFFGKYLVGKKKVSTFATANEKQTLLTTNRADVSEAK